MWEGPKSGGKASLKVDWGLGPPGARSPHLSKQLYLALTFVILPGPPAARPAGLVLQVRVAPPGQCAPQTAPCSEELEMQFALVHSRKGSTTGCLSQPAASVRQAQPFESMPRSRSYQTIGSRAVDWAAPPRALDL
eukprot:1141581-Pelagomonas_calceolata.AAC.3